MKFPCGPALAGVFLVQWLLATEEARAETKHVRLRNESITTQHPSAQAPAKTQHRPRAPASGLFLIQFTGSLQPAWRDALQARNIQLLRYVPEDTFIARLHGANPDDLETLPYVQWVGDYQPAHKIHRSLLPRPAAAPGAPGAPGAAGGATDEVSLLLSPAATPAELAEIRGHFRHPPAEFQHSFGSVLQGRLAPGQLERVAGSPGVLWIEPAPRMKLADEVSSRIVGGPGTNHNTLSQQSGFSGQGVRVAVADSGLHTGNTASMHRDLAGRIFQFFSYGNLGSAADFHGHGTHVAGIVAGNGATGTTDPQNNLFGLGVAPAVTLVAQRIFDGAGNYAGPPSFETLTRDAVQAGAIIGCNSWGEDNQGRYDINAAVFDALVRDADAGTTGDQGYLLVFSAGNAGPGPQSVSSPAVAKNVIATGASENGRNTFYNYTEGAEALADFSSRGPCEDGRIKPDLVAPGTWISSLRSPLGNDANAWLPIDTNYLYMGGTSMAAPQVAGAAAVFVQYYRGSHGGTNPSPALIKAALIHSAADLNDSFGSGPAPNMQEGWGRVNLPGLIDPARRHDYLDQSVLLTTGQAYERTLLVTGTNQPLKVTLTYTDYPGLPAAIPALVNDLDLELIGPNGEVYRGNQFDRGQSVPNAAGADNFNNVEGIRLTSPTPGEYLLRVLGRRIVQDARRDTSPAVDQDFALVVTGDIPPPEAATVLIDRTRYTAPGVINIKLYDLDFAGQPAATATVLARSATEPLGQPVLLHAATSTGILTGAIATATGPATADTRLQIADGNWIRVEYVDPPGIITNTASAQADLIPPLISAVTSTNQFGRTLISWTTDEPATSVARFGTGASLVHVVSNGLLTTTHVLELTNLTAGLTYDYAVSSTDAAGNATTNNNSGALFQVLALPGATVLLVDAYLPEPGDTVIPLAAYTNALNQTDVSYDVWDATSSLFPGFDDLQHYRIVMWRVNDDFNRTGDIIPAPQQAAIQQYLNTGGSFFMASMSILTRMLDQGGADFVTNVLHVQRFDRNVDFYSHCPDCDEDFRVPLATGIGNDILGDNLSFAPNYSAYPQVEFAGIGPDLGDTFGAHTNAASFLIEDVSGKTCGVRFPRTGQDSTGRVVFVSFPLDAIPDNTPAPNNRGDFLRRAFLFLAPGLNGLASIALDQGSYRLPDFITVEVADADLAGQATTTANLHSTFAPDPISVVLQATPEPGLFRGSVPLLSSATPPAPGRLRASHGDQIIAEYLDASGQITIRSAAIVDAIAPTISALQASPRYQDALISWNTSEPADALVQFGESAFLGRTALIPDRELTHAVRLSGLTAGRTYYYRVVSRDQADNTTVDDNNGALYTFQTLPPILASYVDTVENAGTAWAVFNSPTTQFGWRVGAPNNGLVSSAVSGQKVWASDLLGEPARDIDTTLISPAIDLSAGNVATLKFWHAYDFNPRTPFDTLEKGELWMVTNSVSAPTLLATYTGATPGWREAEFDLTPYVGQVIFLIFRHQLQSAQFANRRGWALDNISFLAEYLEPGTIEVTNNLAQARVTLTGRADRTADGPAATFDSLLPGRYIATWSPVPYYITPPAQTNLLEEAGLISLVGDYTFPDANNNGISDLWELHFFGVVSPTRTALTDTDGDGATDYAEFMAGTDPTLNASRLRLLTPVAQTNLGILVFQWASLPGHRYQLQGTFDGIQWVPSSPWLQATGLLQSAPVALPDPSEPFLFRLQVEP